MTREEMYKRLNDVFIDVFDDETIKLNTSMTADDINGWDSLAHIMLIKSIEEEFHVKFSMKETLSLNNVGALVDILLEKIK